MKNNTQRGLLAGMGALIAAFTLALSGVGVANAAPPQPVPAQGSVTVHKLEQPPALGDPATGEQLPPQTGGIDGVTYAAYLVPGIDLNTNAGQQAASALTPASAWTAVADAAAPNEPAAAMTRTTASGGVASFTPLARGVYLFRETAAPAGVTAGADFLVAVPLTDPTNLDAWLTDIYVYPKNARITGDKTVVNAVDYVVGDTATWSISAAIPRLENPVAGAPFVAPDAFRITDTLIDAQLSSTAAGIRVTVPTGLSAPDDYSVEPVSTVVNTGTVAAPNNVPATRWQVTFTPAGRAKLATAVNADANARVTVTVDTQVLASGAITNAAKVYPNAASITNEQPLAIDAAEIRYGDFRVQKDSTDAAVTGAQLAGAQFRVYLSEAAAKAGGNDYLTPTGNPQGLWTTDNTGQFLIEGLRDSGFADGAVVNPGDSAYQTYWLVEVKALEGHQLLAEPLSFTVTQGSTGSATADLTVTNQITSGGFELPLTGGTGTALLTIGGLALLGLVFFVARRRRADA
ncbi:MAG: SpaH/EbpB family LPXTG-anchored major pilin [Propioniciclava sp.]|uniref:SpaH/EbpB family LPXTG-anchored major pilin n=1 Tax=Propioniciclava sp. TaxID=2038686 RepID=UPI0039E2F5D6